MPVSASVDGSASPDLSELPTFIKITSTQSTAGTGPNNSESGAGDASAGFCAPKTYCQKLITRWGENPSEAQCIIQLDDLDSTVPAVAGVPSSPVMSIKRGDLAQIFYENVTLFSGLVIDSPMDIGDDSALLIIKDFRYLLEGVQFIGSWWADIDAGDGPGVHWRNVKAHYNKNNEPNCIFVDVGADILLPVFCPSGYGISDFRTGGAGFSAITVPDPQDQRTDVACYWTPATAMLNAWFACSSTAGDIVAAYSGNFGFYQGCVINESLITFDPNIINTFLGVDATKVTRKAFERVYHCVSINKILEDLCKAQGPYAHNMIMNDDGTNTIQIGRTRYIGADAKNVYGSGAGATNDAVKGVSLQRIAGGVAENDLMVPTVNSGQIQNSAESYFSKVVEVGAHVVIGCRCASMQTYNAFATTAVPLVWAYAEADRLTVKAALLAYLIGGGTDVTTFMRGQFRQYPSLFCEYMLKPGFDFQDGTSQAGYPVALTNRELFPHCVSGFVPSFAGDEFARCNSRYPIPLENSIIDTDAAWLTIPDANGLAIKGRGILSLRLQRDQDLEGNQFSAPGSSAVSQPNVVTYNIQYHYATPADPTTTVIDKFEPRRIRVSLGIPCDQRVIGCLANSSDSSVNMQIGNSETDDSDMINGDNLSRMMAVDTGELAAYEERGGTFGEYPVPQSINRPTGGGYPKAGTEANIYGTAKIVRNDTDYLTDQADKKLREYGRLGGGGNPKTNRLELSAQVFDMIDNIENTGGQTSSQAPIKKVTKQVEHDFVHGTTERILV